MPHAFAVSERTMLGLQSSIGVALGQSSDLHFKEEALVRQDSHRCASCSLPCIFPHPETPVHKQLPCLSPVSVACLISLFSTVRSSAVLLIQEMYRPEKQAYSSLLLETWLNEVLHTSPSASREGRQGRCKVLQHCSIETPFYSLLPHSQATYLCRTAYVLINYRNHRA